MRLQRIAPFSAAKLGAVIYGAFGLIFGAIFSLASVIGAAASTLGGVEGTWSLLFGVGAVIVLPIFYGGVGFLAMALGALIYNLAASWVGGLELDLV